MVPYNESRKKLIHNLKQCLEKLFPADRLRKEAPDGYQK
jgi:hypothetical protein